MSAFPPGRLLSVRAMTCRSCAHHVKERLIGTSVSPNGVWIFLCGRCDRER